jgi:hypothetical protein
MLFILFLITIISCNTESSREIPAKSIPTKSIPTPNLPQQDRISLQEKFHDLRYPPSFLARATILNSNEIRFVEDSLNLKTMYEHARWITYCIACLDTFYYTDYAQKKYNFPPFSTIGEENLVLTSVEGVSKHLQGKKLIANYSLSIAPLNFFFESDSILKEYKRDRFYYRKNVFLCYHYSIKQPTTPIAVEAFSQMHDPIHPSWAIKCPLVRALQILNNPFQPEIIKYVRENEKRINKWFLTEAKKRGMFDSVKYSSAWVEKQITANKQKPKDCIN